MGEKIEHTASKKLSNEEELAKVKENFTMLNQQYNMLLKEYKRVSEQAFYKKLEFDFKVLEHTEKFDKDFVNIVIKEIQEALEVKELEDKEE